MRIDLAGILPVSEARSAGGLFYFWLLTEWETRCANFTTVPTNRLVPQGLAGLTWLDASHPVINRWPKDGMNVRHGGLWGGVETTPWPIAVAPHGAAGRYHGCSWDEFSVTDSRVVQLPSVSDASFLTP